ncbi:DUF4864 domain-containing protein [Mesorhizobium sp. CAU 1732]|uniref:DUF4864 domain-containing protein n=1 Tax=Mesorhizobium sp. CAU 1732 TaxID=3140358 RepID=UPI003261CC4F
MTTLRIAAMSALAIIMSVGAALAGEAEIRAAQTTIDRQLRAFLADDGAAAYSHAAPNIKRMFPTQEAFMGMVRKAYPMVNRPTNYAFGKSKETGTTITQQVLILGPDGNDYEAVYTLELQEDGVFRITGVSLRAATSLST